LNGIYVAVRPLRAGVEAGLGDMGTSGVAALVETSERALARAASSK
jgi:hypothetical protein